LRAGDVVVTARGSLLKCAIVAKGHGGVLPTSNVIVVRPAPVLRPELVLALLRHPWTQNQLMRETSGASVPTLKVASIARLRLVVPAIDEQDELARLMALAEHQYEAALEAARLRRDLALDVVMRKLESKT
jgi:restriction endonuclease S subunit